MTLKNAPLNANLWKKLTKLAEMELNKPWQEVADDLGLPHAVALRLMVSLQEAKQSLLSESGTDDEVFQAWSLGEWCQLVHILEEQAISAQGESKKMVIPLLKQCRLHPAYPLYVQLRQSCQETISGQGAPESLDAECEKRLTVLEECILKHEIVGIERLGHSPQTVIPSKLIHLEGKMTLIGEESASHCLVAIPLGEMKRIKPLGEFNHSRMVAFEVTEFIRALREMGENETRLILKIKDPGSFTATPHYEFLRNVTIITNPEGELIWAAYVEASKELFDWLLEMGSQMEILDPPSFMQEFAAYREEKSRKVA